MYRTGLQFLAVCLVMAFAATSWAVQREAGQFEQEDQVQAPDFFKSDAVMKVEQAYDAAIAEKISEIGVAGGPEEAEGLQGEIENLKEEKVVAVEEALLKIAVEEGNEKEAESIRNDLMLLTREGHVLPGGEGKQPLPGPGDGVRRSLEKNPDDR